MIEQLTNKKVYIDSNVFIYAIENDERFSEPSSVTSELSLAKILVMPLRENDLALVALYEELLSSASVIEVVPIRRLVLMKAAEIRARSGQKMPDSIHAATAHLSQCSAVISQDQRLMSPGLRTIRVSELIKAGPNP